MTNWQRRQNSNNNFSAVVPYDLEQQRKETREMLDDLTTRDQRMMFAVVTLVHLADSKEELDSDTETLQSIARKHLCQLNMPTWKNWLQATGGAERDQAESCQIGSFQPGSFCAEIKRFKVSLRMVPWI